jgi:hypothetical protein
MPTNYFPSTNTGDRWNRFSRIEISNPIAGVASVAIAEQSVLEMGGSEQFVQEVGTLQSHAAPADRFALVDSATGAETGRYAALADLYALAHSFAVHCARQRDANALASLEVGTPEE